MHNTFVLKLIKMEHQDINQNFCQVNEKARTRGRILTGIFLVLAGIVFILDEA